LNGVKSNYYWEVSGLTAMKKELFSQSLEEYSPVVYLAPVKFEIGGYEGNCSSWQDFGLWILKLNEKRDSLNIQTREHIKSLVAGVNNETDKIKILYNFLQNKVRYVSIQEGIGSWQPIDAETVDKVSYGDCKALANYMKSILDVAGIKSYYTLIGAGENATPLINEFPSNRFNHAIICVPVQNDTIWLECTDQEIPFGYLGTFTDNRKALVISDAGGTIVNTRIYSASDNIQVRTGNVKVDNYGNISSTIHTIYKGVNYDTMMPLLRMDKADKATFINSKINIPGYELVKSEYSEIKSMVPSILEVLNLNIHDYGSIAGNNLIIKPNILSRLQNVPPRAASRNSPIIIRRSRCEYDTINYSLQASVKSEIKPNVFSLNTPFGEYRSEIIIHGNSMKYIRMLKLSRGKYLKENYDSFLNFMEKIMIEDNKQITWTRL
jgi:hypothetical protein